MTDYVYTGNNIWCPQSDTTTQPHCEVHQADPGTQIGAVHSVPNTIYIAPPAPPSRTYTTQDTNLFSPDNPNHITGPEVVGWGSGLIMMILVGYFIPTLIAAIRDHRQKLAIFMMNLFLGWTFLGWVIALIWACTADTKGKWESNRKSIWGD